jgi:hypothetical protein
VQIINKIKSLKPQDIKALELIKPAVDSKIKKFEPSEIKSFLTVKLNGWHIEAKVSETEDSEGDRRIWINSALGNLAKAFIPKYLISKSDIIQTFEPLKCLNYKVISK